QAAITVKRYWSPDSSAMIDKLVEVSARLGRPASQVALSWLFGDARVTAAIIGAKTVAQVAENMAAGDDDLSPEVWQELTDAMPLNMGYPYEWTDINVPATFGKAEAEPNHTVRIP